jgi:hypothetical protein
LAVGPVQRAAVDGHRDGEQPGHHPGGGADVADQPCTAVAHDDTGGARVGSAGIAGFGAGAGIADRLQQRQSRSGRGLAQLATSRSRHLRIALRSAMRRPSSAIGTSASARAASRASAARGRAHQRLRVARAECCCARLTNRTVRTASDP